MQITAQELIYAASALRAEARRAERQATDPPFESCRALFENSAKAYDELAAKLARIAEGYAVYSAPMSRPYELAWPDGLGRLISNLVQLEFAIRVALHLQEQEQVRMSTEILRTIKVGDVLPENFLTSWHTLGGLISEYNRLESARGGRILDEKIVDLRDALAHGRLTASTMTGEYNLYRFSRPDRITRSVRVERVERLTLQWLEQQIGWTAQAMQITFDRIQELNPKARRVQPKRR